MFCISTGGHCDQHALRSLANEVCVLLSLHDFPCVDLSGVRYFTTAVASAAAPRTNEAVEDRDVVSYGLSSKDLKKRSLRIRSSQIFCPLIDLSTFLFEESLCELYYALRSSAIDASPVVIPIIDAKLLLVAAKLLELKSSAIAVSHDAPALALKKYVADSVTPLLPDDGQPFQSSERRGGDGARRTPSPPSTSNSGGPHRVTAGRALPSKSPSPSHSTEDQKPRQHSLSGVPSSSAAAQTAVANIANTLHNSATAASILDLLPWIARACFTLTTDLAAAEITTKLMNFAQQLLTESSPKVVRRESVLESYLNAFREHSNNKPNSGIMRILQPIEQLNLDGIKSLVSLDLKYLVIGDAGIKALALAVHRLPCLESLDVRGNGMKDESCHILCRELREHPSLSQLDVSDNIVTNAGVTSLYFLCEENPRVVSLSFEKNVVTSNVWTRRMEGVLARNQSLSCHSAARPLKARGDVVGTLDTATQPPLQMQLIITVDGSSGAGKISCTVDVPREQGVIETVEMEFSIGIVADDGPLLLTGQKGGASWDSQRLLSVALASFVAFGSATYGLNITRLNDLKVPLLYFGDRLDTVTPLKPKSSDADNAAASLQSAVVPLASWSDVQRALLCNSPVRRKSLAFSLKCDTVKQVHADWSAPTAEVIQTLALDLVLNTKHNVFATKVRDVVDRNDCSLLGVDFRVVFHCNVAEVSALESTLGSSSRPPSTSLVGSVRAPVASNFFIESSSIVSITAMAQPFFFPLRVVSSSVALHYRDRIDRCAGALSHEISSLLRLVDVNQRDGDAQQTVNTAAVEALRRLNDAELEATRQAEAGVKVKVTSKWGRGNVGKV